METPSREVVSTQSHLSLEQQVWWHAFQESFHKNSVHDAIADAKLAVNAFRETFNENSIPELVPSSEDFDNIIKMFYYCRDNISKYTPFHKELSAAIVMLEKFSLNAKNTSSPSSVNASLHKG